MVPASLGKTIAEEARGRLQKKFGGEGQLLKMMMHLAAGRFEVSPFREQVVEEFRVWLADLLDVPTSNRGAASGQALHLGVAGALMRKFGDPDWEFLEQLAAGVPLGVGVEMPRTPAVHDPKTKRALDDLGAEPEREVDNYRSTDGVRGAHQRVVHGGGQLGVDGGDDGRASSGAVRGHVARGCLGRRRGAGQIPRCPWRYSRGGDQPPDSRSRSSSLAHGGRA